MFRVPGDRMLLLAVVCPYPAGVNFINILQAVLTSKHPKSVKIHSSCQYLFTLLGLAGVKAAHKMLMKLTPGANFINMLNHSFYSQKCFGTQLLYY